MSKTARPSLRLKGAPAEDVKAVHGGDGRGSCSPGRRYRFVRLGQTKDGRRGGCGRDDQGYDQGYDQGMAVHAIRG